MIVISQSHVVYLAGCSVKLIGQSCPFSLFDHCIPVLGVFTWEKVKHGFFPPFFTGYLSNVSPKYLEIKSAPQFPAKGIFPLDSYDRSEEEKADRAKLGGMRRNLF